MNKEAFLVVDDEAIILMSLRQELTAAFGQRYRIETALSAEEGLEVIEELFADGVRVILIISDWHMPGMKGDKFLIAAKRAHPDVRTIMITGHADAAAVERVRCEAGLIACFPKPWKTEHLQAVISSCLP